MGEVDPVLYQRIFEAIRATDVETDHVAQVQLGQIIRVSHKAAVVENAVKSHIGPGRKNKASC